MTATEIAAEIWRRATTTQPAPDWQIVLLLGAVALVVVASPAWPSVRMLATISHEGGHALVALLTGRRLTGIRLNRDTSGLTVSLGRPRGPGMLATLLAGYPAPAVAGLTSALLLGAGYSVGLLWLVVVLLSAMLIMMRNLYGIAVVLGAGALVVVISWFATPTVQSWAAYLVCWLLLWAAPRPVVELARHPQPGSDADQLRRLTGVPVVAWVGLFAVVTVAAIGAGVVLLLPVETLSAIVADAVG